MPVTAKPPTASSVDHVYQRLLCDIVAGRFPAGARLPSERDLAQTLGASRPTLREALRRLGELRLVETRRGSGVTVRPRTDWSVRVLPAYLKHGGVLETPGELRQLIVDLLALRRALFVQMLRFVGPRLDGKIAAARAGVDRAWEVREDHVAFVRADFDVLRTFAEGSGFLPAVWVLNDFAGVYLELANVISGSAPVPEDYRESYHEVFRAIEEEKYDTACRRLSAYLEGHDRRLLQALGGTP